jgi:hypothetical protein
MSEMACPAEKLKWGDEVRLKTDEKSKGLIVDVQKDATTGKPDYFEVDWKTGQKTMIYHKDQLLLLKPSFDRS